MVESPKEARENRRPCLAGGFMAKTVGDSTTTSLAPVLFTPTKVQGGCIHDCHERQDVMEYSIPCLVRESRAHECEQFHSVIFHAKIGRESTTASLVSKLIPSTKAQEVNMHYCNERLEPSDHGDRSVESERRALEREPFPVVVSVQKLLD